MQVTETLTDGLRRGFSVVVPAEELQGRRDKRLTELGQGLRLPGFRPGKVPMSVVRQRYGSAVKAEVLEQSVSEATERLIEDRGLRPATQPKVDLQGSGDADGVDLAFTVEMEVLPEIVVPDLGALSLTRLVAVPADETVEKALGEVATRNRTLEDLEPRPAEAGDVLVVDYLGRVDGVAFDGGTAADAPVEVSGEGFIPGFSEQMVGMSPGETRTISVTFPEGYPAEALAGKQAEFEITAKALKKSVVPALDDELAKKIGFEEIGRVRDAVREQLASEYGQQSRMRIKRELLDQLAEKTAFEAPASMVEAEFGQIWNRIEADRTAGRLDEEDREKDEAVLRSEYRAIAERRVKLGLLLAEIGRAKGITVSPQEMQQAMWMEANRYPGQVKEVLEFFRQNPRAAETLRGPIFENKVVDYVLELARVEEKTVPPEELAQMPEDVADGADEG